MIASNLEEAEILLRMGKSVKIFGQEVASPFHYPAPDYSFIYLKESLKCGYTARRPLTYPHYKKE